ncbi:Dolichyl-diphosphooligosaccharide-protein glycosyltransferase subunit dad1 [Microsporum ferrugineum]
MSSHQRSTSNAPGPTYFEEQRAELLREISLSLEGVLQNINKFNRNLESIITVGNELSSVEGLWSQFEGVMGRNVEEQGSGNGQDVKDEDRQS